MTGALAAEKETAFVLGLALTESANPFCHREPFWRPRKPRGKFLPRCDQIGRFANPSPQASHFIAHCAGGFFIAGSIAPQAQPEPYPRRTPKREIEAEENAQDRETIRRPTRDDQYPK